MELMRGSLRVSGFGSYQFLSGSGTPFEAMSSALTHPHPQLSLARCTPGFFNSMTSMPLQRAHIHIHTTLRGEEIRVIG